MASAHERSRNANTVTPPSAPPELTVAASSAALGWRHVPALVLNCRVPEFYHFRSLRNSIVFLLGGTTQVEWKRGGRFTRFVSEPGSLTIVPAGDDHHFRTDRQVRVLLWMADPNWLQSIADQEWKPSGPTVEIQENCNNRDAELWALGQRLAARMLSPVAGSRLYAESLSTQLALHLLWNYSSLPRQSETPVLQRTDPRLCRAIDYIHASLAREISLGELADIAGLSPNYFLSSFKRATGKTPHRYLTEKRIDKACELLHNPHDSIVAVSLAVGYSSQSHLTTVFRRLMKTTPAAYREDVLGRRVLSLNPERKRP
jgi:AraC family transcriptional regulator